MADIVTRLRHHPHYAGSPRPCEWCAAVAEIERLRAENALLASYLYPVGMMLNPDAMTLRPTTLFDDGIDGITAEEVEEFLEADREDDLTAPIPAESLPPAPPAEPHDHKGHSEEKCIRCGWVMGHCPLNCMNDDTPHVFPSQLPIKADIEDPFPDVQNPWNEINRLRTALAIAAGMLSTYVVVGDSHPETMLNELLAEADKAIAKEADRG